MEGDTRKTSVSRNVPIKGVLFSESLILSGKGAEGGISKKKNLGMDSNIPGPDVINFFILNSA